MTVTRITANNMKQKKRKYGRDDQDGPDAKAEEDPLKDATTLYVGNLYVCWTTSGLLAKAYLGHSIRLKNRSTSCFLSEPSLKHLSAVTNNS